jgi:hypothetical protein
MDLECFTFLKIKYIFLNIDFLEIFGSSEGVQLKFLYYFFFNIEKVLVTCAIRYCQWVHFKSIAIDNWISFTQKKYYISVYY